MDKIKCIAGHWAQGGNSITKPPCGVAKTGLWSSHGDGSGLVGRADGVLPGVVTRSYIIRRPIINKRVKLEGLTKLCKLMSDVLSQAFGVFRRTLSACGRGRRWRPKALLTDGLHWDTWGALLRIC